MEKFDIVDRLLKEGKYQEAIKLCEEIHRAHPEEESALLKLAWAYYDSGAIAEAVSRLEILFSRELQRKIFTGFAYDELVRIFKQEKKFAKLIEVCSRAAEAQPEDTALLTELGNAYREAGRHRDACTIYEKLIRMESDNPAFYCLLGEALFAAGLYAESEAAYLNAAQIDPDGTDGYYFKIADLFSKKGNYREAERLLKKCIELCPPRPVYHCSLGDILIGMGKIKDAEKEYEIAAGSESGASGAYYNRLGNSLAKENYHTEAAQAFEKALAREPGNPVYAKNLALALKKSAFSG